MHLTLRKLINVICLTPLLLIPKSSSQSLELPPVLPEEPVSIADAVIDIRQRPEFLALRDTIAYAEGTWNAQTGCPNYNYRFGDNAASGGSLDVTQPHPLTVIRSPWGGRYASNASGAYQYLDSTWREMNNGINAVMSPENQDRALLKLLQQRVRYDFDRPFDQQVHLLAPTWASFPTRYGLSYYGQPVVPVSVLINFYNQRLSVHQQQAPTGAFNDQCL